MNIQDINYAGEGIEAYKRRLDAKLGLSKEQQDEILGYLKDSFRSNFNLNLVSTTEETKFLYNERPASCEIDLQVLFSAILRNFNEKLTQYESIKESVMEKAHTSMYSQFKRMFGVDISRASAFIYDGNPIHPKAGDVTFNSYANNCLEFFQSELRK